jgi:hypothetical protein
MTCICGGCYSQQSTTVWVCDSCGDGMLRVEDVFGWCYWDTVGNVTAQKETQIDRWIDDAHIAVGAKDGNDDR